MREAALIPLRIFRNSTFSIGIGISIVVGAAMFGGIVLIPQYLQVVRGSSPTLAGLQMLPLVIGLMAASITSGRIIARTGRYRIFPLVGSVLLMLGAYLLHFVTAVTPMWVVMAFMAIIGFGIGNLMPPLMLALQNALPARDMGISTAAATFFRQIGGTLGVAVFLSILFSQLAGQHRRRTARRGGPARVPSGGRGRTAQQQSGRRGARQRSRRQRSVRRAARPHRQLDRPAAQPGAGPAVPGRLRRLDVDGVPGRHRGRRGRADPRAVLEGGAAAHPGRTAGARGGGAGMTRCRRSLADVPLPRQWPMASAALSGRRSLALSGRPAPSAGRRTARPRPRPPRGRPIRSPRRTCPARGPCSARRSA